MLVGPAISIAIVTVLSVGVLDIWHNQHCSAVVFLCQQRAQA